MHSNTMYIPSFSHTSDIPPCREQLWDKSISHGFHDLQLCTVYLAWLKCLKVQVSEKMHIFPTYMSVYILTKSECISSCIRPAVGLNIVQITRSIFCKCSFFRWPPVAILDVQKSLLTISDQYHNFYVCDFFYKMAAGGHFGCSKLTFDGISGHFRSIRNFASKHFYKIAAGVLGSNVLG